MNFSIIFLNLSYSNQSKFSFSFFLGQIFTEFRPKFASKSLGWTTVAMETVKKSTKTRVCNKLRKMHWTHLDCLEKPLSRFYERYGRFVSRHPWPFVLFPILISCGLSLGFLHKNEVTDATYLYTPIGENFFEPILLIFAKILRLYPKNTIFGKNSDFLVKNTTFLAEKKPKFKWNVDFLLKFINFL